MEENDNTIELAVALTTAWLGNPNTRSTPDEIHTFLKNSHSTIIGLSQPKPEASPESTAPPEAVQAAVTVRKSLSNPDFIYSMVDGKPYKTMRRHLASHGLTPETYRERYGLKPDYPMVAPNYSAHRSKVAKQLGLGRKRAAAAEAAPANAPVAEPKAQASRRPRASRTAKSASVSPEPAEA